MSNWVLWIIINCISAMIVSQVYEWRNKWITSRAETIDDFIKVFEHRTGTLKRWKERGIELD